ncbi:RimK/LysX family protein [Vibrio hippocampi]|uniref:Retropepsin-like aspartic endopeptidase domain-containing protein n=1 Tax=Vibrio hippocampi TaxID=654686 RepID=A0ABM8ZER8_9VIBR|nr:RimK/LysX family protein [Vibrio hippocampi]CAH0524387.1 hypothetical protein VHP8226_00214 [Vibrio hippocampi]
MKQNLARALISLMILWSTISFAASDLSTTGNPPLSVDEKVVLGRLENVYMQDVDSLVNVPFMGKIDTGADTTSMHATQISVESQHPDFQDLKNDKLLKAMVEKFGASGQDWREYPNQQELKQLKSTVSFVIRHPYTGEAITLKRPLTRASAIRSRSSEEPIYRPVVTLPLTIADTRVDTEVNLTDRSGFSSPILIGKTFLENHAWVLAGYDYLQQQSKARMIGRSESGFVQDTPVDVSLSLVNNYSILGASNIDIDDKAQTVTFDLQGRKGKMERVTYPITRMLKVSGKSYPLIYVPFKSGENFNRWILVYLKDRSKLSTQLRLGLNTINQYFVIDTAGNNLLQEKPQLFSDRLKNKPLVVSPVEEVVLDGYPLKAKPSFVVSTPLLKVQSFETIEAKGADKVEYFLSDLRHGGDDTIRKTILRKIKVGDTVRPVVDGEFIVGGQRVDVDFALEVLDDGEGDEPYFIIGKKARESGVLVNPRSEQLLESYPIFKAGHIENATVEGLTFPVKLDTGADVSSISATDIKQFEKEGKSWVTFTYSNDMGMKQEFTREVVGSMRIKAKKGEKSTARPVVKMKVKLGEVEKTIRVNLQDRSRFHYSMILGKNFLRYGALVSSEQNFLLGNEIDSY